MPIRPQHRWLYPIDWQQLTDMVRFERAKERCEQCARPHGKIVCHLGDGRWWDEELSAWRNGKGRMIRKETPPAPKPDHAPITRVYLATAHLDNNPGHNEPAISRLFASAATSLSTGRSICAGAG
jgi:hypothetical protein